METTTIKAYGTEAADVALHSMDIKRRVLEVRLHILLCKDFVNLSYRIDSIVRRRL